MGVYVRTDDRELFIIDLVRLQGDFLTDRGHPEELHCPAPAGQVDCKLHRLRFTDALDHNVAALDRGIAQEGGRITLRWIENQFSPEFGCDAPLVLNRFQDDHACRSGIFRELEHDQPDRSPADDDHRVAGLHTRPVYSVHGTGDRLDERARLFCHCRRNEENLTFGYDRVLSHAPVDVDTECLQVRAEMHQAAPAEIAYSAGDVGIDSDPPSD